MYFVHKKWVQRKKSVGLHSIGVNLNQEMTQWHSRHKSSWSPFKSLKWTVFEDLPTKITFISSNIAIFEDLPSGIYRKSPLMPSRRDGLLHRRWQIRQASGSKSLRKLSPRACSTFLWKWKSGNGLKVRGKYGGIGCLYRSNSRMSKMRT